MHDQAERGAEMPGRKINTVIVGGGQAGLATSRHLCVLGIENIVLEKDRIAEAWRTGRWDSLVANGPAWHDRFPDKRFDQVGDDDFAAKEACARYFEDYAREHSLPVRTGVEVFKAEPLIGRSGYRIECSDGIYEAQNIVAATGPFQIPVVPPVVPNEAPVSQMHSANYRNPEQLEPGGVLVVGSGSSGVQIADELLRSGRKVFLSVGPHDRPPRRYRGKDFVWWLGALGLWDMKTPPAGREHVTIAVSGAYGGATVDFRDLAERGIGLVGMTEAFREGKITFRADLAKNIRDGDRNYLSLLDAADAHIAENGLDFPEEPGAKIIGPDHRCMTDPVLEIDLEKEGIGTILWATGYRQDFSWLKVDSFDEAGRAVHEAGVSKVPGIYFVGLPWLSMRGSSFIWGAYKDAQRLAGIIAGRRQGAIRSAPQNMRQ